MNVPDKSMTFALIAIVFVAMAGAFTGMDKGLWMDEYATISFAEDPQFFDRAAKYNTPPTYFALVRGARWLGLEEVGLRALSLLFYLAAIVFIGAALWREVGAMPCTLTCLWLVSRPLLLYHSHEVRPYALLLFFVALGIWGALRLPPQSRRLRWVWWGACTGMALTHAIGLVCVPVLAALRRWKFPECRFPLHTLGFLGVSSLVLVLALYGKHLDGTWWADAHLKAGLGAHLLASFGHGAVSQPWTSLTPFLTLAQGSLTPWLIAALYPLTLLGISHGFVAVLIQRAFTPFLFLLAPAIAYGIGATTKPLARLGLTALMGVTILDGFASFQETAHLPRANLKGTEAYFSEVRRPHSFLVLPWYYYNQRLGTFYAKYDKLLRLPRAKNEMETAWAQILEHGDRTSLFHVVLPEPHRVGEPARQVIAQLEERYATRRLSLEEVKVLEVFPRFSPRPEQRRATFPFFQHQDRRMTRLHRN